LQAGAPRDSQADTPQAARVKNPSETNTAGCIRCSCFYSSSHTATEPTALLNPPCSWLRPRCAMLQQQHTAETSACTPLLHQANCWQLWHDALVTSAPKCPTALSGQMPARTPHFLSGPCYQPSTSTNPLTKQPRPVKPSSGPRSHSCIYCRQARLATPATAAAVCSQHSEPPHHHSGTGTLQVAARLLESGQALGLETSTTHQPPPPPKGAARSPNT
jgi:hypothetical protein